MMGTHIEDAESLPPGPDDSDDESDSDTDSREKPEEKPAPGVPLDGKPAGG